MRQDVLGLLAPHVLMSWLSLRIHGTGRAVHVKAVWQTIVLVLMPAWLGDLAGVAWLLMIA